MLLRSLARRSVPIYMNVIRDAEHEEHCSEASVQAGRSDA